jgi:hypothetical protein
MFESHSPHLNPRNKKHHQDKHKPMIEWKMPGFCASTKCPSCVFGPNKQYFGIIGNHPWSSDHLHSSMPTKFLYDCHKFASWCTLTLIRST